MEQILRQQFYRGVMFGIALTYGVIAGMALCAKKSEEESQEKHASI